MSNNNNKAFRSVKIFSILISCLSMRYSVCCDSMRYSVCCDDRSHLEHRYRVHCNNPVDLHLACKKDITVRSMDKTHVLEGVVSLADLWQRLVGLCREKDPDLIKEMLKAEKRGLCDVDIGNYNMAKHIKVIPHGADQALSWLALCADPDEHKFGQLPDFDTCNYIFGPVQTVLVTFRSERDNTRTENVYAVDWLDLLFSIRESVIDYRTQEYREQIEMHNRPLRDYLDKSPIELIEIQDLDHDVTVIYPQILHGKNTPTLPMRVEYRINCHSARGRSNHMSLDQLDAQQKDTLSTHLNNIPYQVFLSANHKYYFLNQKYQLSKGLENAARYINLLNSGFESYRFRNITFKPGSYSKEQNISIWTNSLGDVLRVFNEIDEKYNFETDENGDVVQYINEMGWLVSETSSYKTDEHGHPLSSKPFTKMQIPIADEGQFVKFELSIHESGTQHFFGFYKIGEGVTFAAIGEVKAFNQFVESIRG